MRLIIFGPPASGKGTQAPFFTEKFNIPHISTGAMFREETKKDTKLGLKIKQLLDKGHLIDDETTNLMVKDRLSMPDAKNGFLLDGYPRTLNQAKYLDEMLNEAGLKLDYAIDLFCDDEIAIKRITGRRMCPKCGKIYNIYFTKPSVDGICDVDGTLLIRRADDTVEIAKKRLEIYYQSTEPLINYYKNKGNMILADGGLLDAAHTFDQIINKIGDKK